MFDTFWFVALMANSCAVIFFATLASKVHSPKPAYYYKPL